MANSMKLEQHYRDNYSIFFLVGFLLLTLLKVSQLVLTGFNFTLEFFGLIAVVLALCGVIYILVKSTLKVKFGKKKISIQIQPLGFTKIKFRKDKIQKIDFVKTSTITKSSGMLVHFGNKDRVFNFGGNRAMVITLLDGRKYSFFSKELFEQKAEILNNIFPTAHT